MLIKDKQKAKKQTLETQFTHLTSANLASQRWSKTDLFL